MAIVPLSALRRGIVHDVEFIGWLDDVAVTRNGPFTTQ
jgi:hypothetical protein